MGFPSLAADKKNICILCFVLPLQLQSDCCNPLQHVRKVNHSGWYNYSSFPSEGEINTMTPPEITSMCLYSMCACLSMFITLIQLHRLSHLWYHIYNAPSIQNTEIKTTRERLYIAISFPFFLTNTTLQYNLRALRVKAHLHYCLYTWFTSCHTHTHTDKKHVAAFSPPQQTMKEQQCFSVWLKDASAAGHLQPSDAWPSSYDRCL